MSNKFRKIVALTVGLASGGLIVEQAQAIALNFGNTPGGQIVFDGTGRFDFTPGGVASGVNNSARITGSSGGALTIGDFMTMTGPAGGWAFNSVSGTVTGVGTLDIEDVFGNHLTASLSFVKLNVNAPGTGGQFNQTLGINLSGISYPIALDPDLAALASAGSAIETLSFTFPTLGHSLANLATVRQTTSFSGSLISVPTTPDGGATMALLGFALLTVEGLRRKLTK